MEAFKIMIVARAEGGPAVTVASFCSRKEAETAIVRIKAANGEMGALRIPMEYWAIRLYEQNA